MKLHNVMNCLMAAVIALMLDTGCNKNDGSNLGWVAGQKALDCSPFGENVWECTAPDSSTPFQCGAGNINYLPPVRVCASPYRSKGTTSVTSQNAAYGKAKLIYDGLQNEPGSGVTPHNYEPDMIGCIDTGMQSVSSGSDGKIWKALTSSIQEKNAQVVLNPEMGPPRPSPPDAGMGTGGSSTSSTSTSSDMCGPPDAGLLGQVTCNVKQFSTGALACDQAIADDCCGQWVDGNAYDTANTDAVLQCWGKHATDPTYVCPPLPTGAGLSLSFNACIQLGPAAAACGGGNPWAGGMYVIHADGG